MRDGRRRRIILPLGWRTNVVMCINVWRWCDGVSDAVDLHLLHELRICSLGLRLHFSFVRNLSAIPMNVVRGVFHNLHAAVGQVNLVAAMNSSVLLLLSVGKVVARLSVFDCV